MAQAEGDSQPSSASTVDYMEMGSEGFDTGGKRALEADGAEEGGDGPSNPKKPRNDDWMDDGNLFTKIVKTKSQEAASSNGIEDQKTTEAIETRKSPGSSDDVKIVGETSSSSKQTHLQKIDSIQEDAEKIADLLELKNVQAVRARLRKVRKNPDRIDLVTNQLLEEDEDVCEVVDVKEGGVKKDEKDEGCEVVSVVKPGERSHTKNGSASHGAGEDDVMQAMLSDIKEVCNRLKKRNPKATFDTNTAYLLLESNLNKRNRVDVVVNEMLPTESLEPSPALETEPSPALDNEHSASVETTQEQSASLDNNTGKYSAKTVKSSEIVEICDKTKESETPAETSGDNVMDILEEVGVIMKKFPKADANRVYALLECRENDKNRLKAVINILEERPENTANTAQNGAKTDRTESKGVKRVLSESAVVDDPLYKDMLKISKIFPDIDKNEIYALCEVHHDKKRRVEVVTEELLRSKREEDGESQSAPLESDTPGKGSAKVPSPKSSKKDKTSPVKGEAGSSGADEASAPRTPLEELSDNVEHMSAIFPDCDPDYLYYMLEQRFADPNRVPNLTAEMFDRKNYPKLKDRIEKEKKAANIRRIKKMDFKMDEFLQMFPNALTDFHDETKAMTETYQEHAQIHLRNSFPFIQTTYIARVLTAHNYHFVPTLRQLEIEAADYMPNSTHMRRRRRGGAPGPGRGVKRFRKIPRTHDTEMPEQPDEYFYKELMFSRHEQEIKDHLQKQEDEKVQRLEEARSAGELQECTCCYDDEVLFEDMSSCPDGHLYCNECLKRSAESGLGEGKVTFPCFEENCDLEFPKSALQKVLSSKMFSTLLRKIQEEEIRQADIPDLVCCPYCSFATIIPEDEPDKVFRCMNPECLKESCRLCKEPNHIPLRCNEVEKKGETDMRTFIENKITEAMIRTCWKCKKRFFKTEGCNKMTCPCGASMCYVCQAPNIDYNHFGPNSCPNDTDVRKLHLEEMEKAGKLAREKYEKEHPEMSGKRLKHDPFKVIKQAKKTKNGAADWLAGADAFGNNYGDDDDGDSDDGDYPQENSSDDSDSDIDEVDAYPGYAVW